MVIHINHTLTGNWKTDRATVIAIAEAPTTAAKFYVHAQVVLALFNRLTHETPSAPNYPERSGLARKVHDELFPIAHFAKLRFAESNNVSIRWHHGSQQFDATVEDRRPDPDRSSIHYLEVTTLQDKEDAEMLQRLAESKEGVVKIEGDLDQTTHTRKVALLKKALEKKGAINYPTGTALLVYTDEDRFRQFSFGVPQNSIDKKGSFRAVLEEMKHLLGGFSEVCVYSKNEIYCLLQPDTV